MKLGVPQQEPGMALHANAVPEGGPCSAKRITSRADLAVNGAEPAFGAPLHVGRPWSPGRKRFLELVEGMFEREWLTNDGPLVREFERQVASYLGVRNCVATCNGTAAIEVAARAAGLTGEVIVPAFTFIATAHALSWQGLIPVFADIDPDTHQVDPDCVRRLVTPRTGGILAVNVWGGSAPAAELESIAREHGLPLLMDSAHGFGTAVDGRRIGWRGSAEAFSFHATKCLHSFEGGAIATDDDNLAARAREIRAFGLSGHDRSVRVGTNAKMAEVCAAMGIANLEHVERAISANRDSAHLYRDGLAGVHGIRLYWHPESCASNLQYSVVEVGPECGCTRDEMLSALRAEGVLARRYFWPGCHRMEPYDGRREHAPCPLPHTDAVASRVLALPTGPSLPHHAIARVCEIIRVMATR
jgi:dTDP-4-amino-4,6-dideoxygalactose transaminase